jgi:hypothetical protein
MKRACLAFQVLAASAVAPLLFGQEPAPAATPSPIPKPAALNMFVYPGKGQDPAKQGQDENECYAWARQQSGIDPMATPKPAETADAPRGGAVKGAAAGAAAGAAVGAITGDTGDGAAVGATAGAVKGRRAQKKAQKKAEAQAQQTAQAQDAQAKETFKKAWGACLEGRGYAVK